MKKQSRYALLAIFITILLQSTTAFAMLERLYRKRTEQRVKDALKEEGEISRIIEEKQDKAYNDCVEELALITNEPFAKVKAKTDRDREWIKEHLKSPNPNAFHDHTMPDHLYKKSLKSMREEGVNPYSVILKYNQDPNSKILATAGTELVLLDCHLPTGLQAFDTLSPLLKHLVVPEINLYEKLDTHKEHQDFILKHELYHELSRHHTMEHIAFNANPYADRKDLQCAFEKEANIRAASTSSKIACTGMDWQCRYGHRNILDNKLHCKEMTEMCKLMTRKEELEREIEELLS